MIVSVPTELDQDHMEIMSLAWVTIDEGMQLLHWPTDRVERAITLLLQEGMTLTSMNILAFRSIGFEVSGNNIYKCNMNEIELTY